MAAKVSISIDYINGHSHVNSHLREGPSSAATHIYVTASDGVSVRCVTLTYNKIIWLISLLEPSFREPLINLLK